MIIYRNSFTYAAYIFVLALSLFFFMVIPSDVLSLPGQFRVLCIVCVVLGSVTSLFYTLSVREIPLTKLALEREAVYQ